MTVATTASAQVRVADQLVGWLDYFEPHETFRLVFAEAWLNRPHRRLLGQLFEDALPGPIDSAGLHGWFQGLLPQGHMRKFMSRRYGMETYDAWPLLLELGGDLPGAVTVTPCQPRHAARRPPTPPPRPAASPHAIRPKHSLTGMQWKLTVSDAAQKLVIPVRSQAGDWIAKFHDPSHPGMPRLEQGISRWAAAAGIDVPRTRLGAVAEFERLPAEIPVGDGVVFLSWRFDRNPLCHMEDFAQILGRARQQNGTAEEIAVIIGALCPGDAVEYVRRLVFCVLAGNGDAHLKNWSLVYPDGRTARLSPAYDLISTIVFPQWRNDQLTLPIGGQTDFATIEPRHFEPVGELLGLPDVTRVVCDLARSVRQSWKGGGGFGLPGGQVAAIDAHLDRVGLGT